MARHGETGASVYLKYPENDHYYPYWLMTTILVSTTIWKNYWYLSIIVIVVNILVHLLLLPATIVIFDTNDVVTCNGTLTITVLRYLPISPVL